MARITAYSRHSGDFSTLNDADLRIRIAAEICNWEFLRQYGRLEEACDLAERAIKLTNGRLGLNDSFSLWCLRAVADQDLSMDRCERALGTYDKVRELAQKLPPGDMCVEISDIDLLPGRAQMLD